MVLWCARMHSSDRFSPCVSITGRHCESVIDVCPRKPCQNGGTCAVASNMPDGFICQCPPVSAVSWNSITCLNCRVLWLTVTLASLGQHWLRWFSVVLEVVSLDKLYTSFSLSTGNQRCHKKRTVENKVAWHTLPPPLGMLKYRAWPFSFFPPRVILEQNASSAATVLVGKWNARRASSASTHLLVRDATAQGWLWERNARPTQAVPVPPARMVGAATLVLSLRTIIVSALLTPKAASVNSSYIPAKSLWDVWIPSVRKKREMAIVMRTVTLTPASGMEATVPWQWRILGPTAPLHCAAGCFSMDSVTSSATHPSACLTTLNASKIAECASKAWSWGWFLCVANISSASAFNSGCTSHLVPQPPPAWWMCCAFCAM